MIWTPLTRRAYVVACTAHAGQVDSGGNPYIQHPLAVAEQMPDEELAAAALLHDVIEDTRFTAEDLAGECEIPMGVVAIVCALTRFPDSGMTYAQYVESIKSNPRAVIVKKADLQHNMDLSRLNREPTERDLSKLERYRKALEILDAPSPWEPAYLEKLKEESSPRIIMVPRSNQPPLEVEVVREDLFSMDIRRPGESGLSSETLSIQKDKKGRRYVRIFNGRSYRKVFL